MAVVSHDVVDLARHGLYPVRLHYPIFRDDGVFCSCGKADCKNSKGKHPVASAWGKAATQDEDIIQEQWSSGNWNVGIILGPCHGIPADQAVIDIEDDTPEGREFADILLDGYPAPTFTSGKSLHRLYRWTPDLPETGKASITINGLEFRFGGKGRETQSVAPPSIHHSGAQYKWVEGKSLDDLPITDIPKHVIDLVCQRWAEQAHSRGPSNTDARRFRSPQGKIGPGARHGSLLIEANSLWRKAFQIWGINGIEDQEAIDQVWMWLMGANLLVCEPPKTEAEVKVIFQSSQSFMQKEFEKELEAKQKTTDPALAQDPHEAHWERSFGAWLHKHSIRLITDPAMDPTQQNTDRIDEWTCEWKMRYVTQGDEDLVQIEIDSFPPISMNTKEFEIAKTFARKVQQQTGGKFILNTTFTMWDWNSIWDGRPNDRKRANGITRGLREHLLAKAIVEEQKANGLSDQIEDLIAAMSGNLHQLLEGLSVYTAHGHQFEGRLKVVPGGGLTEIRDREDSLTGYYYTGGKILLLVRVDEISRRFRSSYGGVIVTRQIVETLEKLGFSKERIQRGPLSGRWFIKEEIIQE